MGGKKIVYGNIYIFFPKTFQQISALTNILLYLLHSSVTSQKYDATVLCESYAGPELDILIDQGREDQFLTSSQLLPDNLIAACSKKKIPLALRLQEVSTGPIQHVVDVV